MRTAATILFDTETQLEMVDKLMVGLAKRSERAGVPAEELKDKNGVPLVIPLLQIRANLVLTEALLRANK